MENVKEELEKWLAEISDFKHPELSNLPDIDLYMDQVITYLDRILKPYASDDSKVLTSSMINNYVKAKLIPAPNGKKYTRNHISYMLIIAALKQILSISDIEKLFYTQRKKENFSIYNLFKDTYDSTLLKKTKAFEEKVKNVNVLNENDELSLLALNLTIEATINKLIAEKIFTLMHEKENQEIEEIKKLAISDESKKKQPKEKN